jgi:membrane-associated phospholipid phosphatase
MILGTPAMPLVLQHWRLHWLDLIAVAVHASHFAFFLLFGLILWHLRPAHFGHYRRGLLLVMAIGLVGYAGIPTVPPWLAFEQFHLLPFVAHTIVQVYTSFSGELYGTFDTNPVAAMPSLHAAFPVMCASVAWRAFGKRVGILIAAYAATMMLAVMYLGEHYAVDVFAGIAVGLIAARAGRHAWTPSFSLARSLAVSGAAVALTFAILLAFH